MGVYIGIFLLFWFSKVYEKFSDKNTQNFIFGILMISFILTSGLRDMIGGYDVYVYRSVYEYSINNIFIDSTFEIGFKYYFLFLKILGIDTHQMFFITAFIIGLTHLLAIRKYSFNKLLFFSLFLYFCKFYLMSYVYLRQGMAMGIVWLSIYYVLKRQFIPFLLLILLGMSFHSSAIVFLPIYFLTKEIKNKYVILIPLLSLFFISLPIIPVVVELLSNYLVRFGGYALRFGATFNFFYLIEAIVCVFILWCVNSLSNYKKWEKTLIHIIIFNGFLIYVILLIFSIRMGVFVRLSWYYLIFYALAIPIYTILFSRKINSINSIILVLVYSILFFRLLIIWDGGDFIPYKSILDETIRNSIWSE